MNELNMEAELFLVKREYGPADPELVMSYLSSMPSRSEPMSRLRVIEGIVHAYASRDEYDKALAFINEEISGTYDGKYIVWLRYLGGSICEHMRDYKLAAKYYKRALLDYRKNDMRHIENIFITRFEKASNAFYV